MHAPCRPSRCACHAALAYGFRAAAGAQVVIDGRSAGHLADAAKRLARSDRLATVAGDMTVPAVDQTIVDAVVSRFGGLITAPTRNLAVELIADHIRINAVAPGTVPTPLYGNPEARQLKALNAVQPLGRYGLPENVAEAVFHLANATWAAGVVLPVDGGVAAGGATSSSVH